MTKAEKAFTLVEILVALVVLAVAAVPLLQSFAGGLRASDGARQQSYAMLLAQSKMAAVGTELPLEPGAIEGRFDNRFAWEVIIAAEADAASQDAPGTEVMSVTVTVSWPSENRRNSIELTSARLRLDINSGTIQ